TYAPSDHLFAADSLGPSPQKALQPVGVLTVREQSVVRGIKEGKSNKVIAYELNMCESTVKVHVRNVMKKLKAKNRTEVAMKAQSVSSTFPQTNTCFALGTTNQRSS